MTRTIKVGAVIAAAAAFAIVGCSSDKASNGPVTAAASATTSPPTTAERSGTTVAPPTTAAVPTSASPPATSAAPATTVAVATTGAPSTTVAAGPEAPVATSLSIESFAFVVPTGLKAGAAVTITNEDSAQHTFTDKSGKFDVPVPANGGTAQVDLPAAGTYELICKIHPSMSGTLTVG